MQNLTQENRKIQVFSPLGDNVLLFYRMLGRESLNELFEYNLELLSENQSINPDSILGQNMTIRIQLENGGWRYFNGYVSSFGQIGTQNVLAKYVAIVRPWLWFLTRASNCRIFQNKNVRDIITQVFNDQGFSDLSDKLTASYASREYCVQYRETDFNFVSRLMEEEGICYYFKHENGKHLLVLVDQINTHEKYPDYDKIPYYPELASAKHPRQDHIHHWSYSREVQPGSYELTEYDFRKPKLNLLVKSNIKEAHAHSAYEFFDYPGLYKDPDVGEKLVHHRIEEQHALLERYRGKCNVRGLCVGYLFELENFPLAEHNQEYLVTSADYELFMDEYMSDGNHLADENLFVCACTAQSSKRAFRPRRKTPKPLVQGAQTAFVVGPPGEELHTDAHGRVKVHFHWDRKDRWEAGKQEQNSSCWIRVSHPWAGKNWGSISIPRIGQEVIVSFLEGDPDQPIITGRVYNADSMPPYTLPAGAVVSGLKSNTHKGKGYNEMSMDDTAGKEGITIHGQYDMNTTVEHDQTNTVNNDFTETIKNNAKIEITEGTYKHDVKAGTADYHVQAALTENYDATQTTTVKQDITIISTGGPITISADSQHIYIHAATSIQLQVGASQLWMASDGRISLNGVNVAINGSESVSIAGGSVRSTAQSEHEISGAIVKSEGSATNTVKGGMVMLNP